MTIKEFKRRMCVGAKVELVHHYVFDVATRPSFAGVRTVVAVNAKELVFSNYACLTWPKVGNLRETPNGFELCAEQNGTFSKVMRYEWR